MKTIKISLLGCLILLCSCANVKFYSDSSLKNETGIQVYSSKPYLKIERIKVKDSLTTKASVIYIPDLKHPQYIKIKTGLGTSKLNFVLENSILKTYGLETDTKLPETLNSITGLVTGLVSTAATRTPNKSEKEPVFELYEFVIDNDNIILQRVTIKE